MLAATLEHRLGSGGEFRGLSDSGWLDLVYFLASFGLCHFLASCLISIRGRESSSQYGAGSLSPFFFWPS